MNATRLQRTDVEAARAMALHCEGRAHLLQTLATHLEMWGLLNQRLALVPATDWDINEKLTLELNIRELREILGEAQP